MAPSQCRIFASLRFASPQLRRTVALLVAVTSVLWAQPSTAAQQLRQTVPTTQLRQKLTAVRRLRPTVADFASDFDHVLLSGSGRQPRIPGPAAPAPAPAGLQPLAVALPSAAAAPAAAPAAVATSAPVQTAAASIVVQPAQPVVSAAPADPDALDEPAAQVAVPPAGLVPLPTTTAAPIAPGLHVVDPAFLNQCVAFSKALVYKEHGDKRKVDRQMKIACSGFDYAPDAQTCSSFLETMLGHLHDDDSHWNMNGMDYPLFCTGMSKVLTTMGFFKQAAAAAAI